MKIALAMIVRGSVEEAGFLDRCLTNIENNVDGIFITSTYKKGEAHSAEVDIVCAKHKANVSYFEWVNDFAAARNFNFAQVTKEYDYILWCDADDTFMKLEDLRPALIASPQFDVWTMQYCYDRDESGNPTVVHTKSQVLRNDNCVSWIGKIHEDFEEKRKLEVNYIDSVKRIHMTTHDHVVEARKRNIEISLEDVKSRPDDPRAYFNLGNSYLGHGDFEEAKVTFNKFVEVSGSDAEKYLAYQRLAHIEQKLGNRDKAVEYLQISIGLFPNYPDSYFLLGYALLDYGDLERAEFYLLYPLAIKMQPQYQKMIVYNPRDYDYNPMKALAKLYFRKSRPDLALPMLKGCSEIYPEDKTLKVLVDEMTKETDRLKKVLDAVKHVSTLGDNKEKILYTINKLPIDLQSHPAICRIRNEWEVKETSTGKDIAYYCGETAFQWNPELFKTKGFGGSEEAVINLSKEWKKQGYNVTVYNSCGIEPMICDGVTYKPWWMFNGKDKWDHLVLWRSPALAGHEINATNIYVDLHDVIAEGEFTEKRLNRIKKIFVKTKAHRALFPNLPDEKFSIIPNGMDFGLFQQDIKRDPYLLVNTSSPDRSMDILPKLFLEVKKRVPEARLKWAYGWDNFDTWHGGDKRLMEWRHKIAAEMKDAGIEDCGRLSQAECAKLYLEGSILAYPSDFYEIDCISVKKAQACGCIPITTDFAAFDESVQYGVKVHTDRTIKDWSLPYQIGFGTKDKAAQRAWVDAVVRQLTRTTTATNEQERAEGTVWSYKFAWPLISNQWISQLENL